MDDLFKKLSRQLYRDLKGVFTFIAVYLLALCYCVIFPIKFISVFLLKKSPLLFAGVLLVVFSIGLFFVMLALG